MSKSKIVLKALKKFNTIWHPESTVVFKSQSDKKVIGRFENDSIIELDEHTLELCETWGFKYDTELFEKNFGETENDLDGSTSPPADENRETSPPTDEPDEPLPEVNELEIKKEIQPTITLDANTNTNVNTLTTSSVTSYITTLDTSIYNDLTSQINHILKTNVMKFTDTETKLKQELQLKLEELDNTQKLLLEMTSKYENIKSKFDAMKQIFS